MSSMRSDLGDILGRLYEEVNKLTAVLETVQYRINDLSKVPLAQMSVSDKIKWAEVLMLPCTEYPEVNITTDGKEVTNDSR